MIARELFENEKEYIVHLSKNGLTAREILDKMCETELTVNDIEDIINDYLGSFRYSGESIKQIIERMKKEELPQSEIDKLEEFYEARRQFSKNGWEVEWAGIRYTVHAETLFEDISHLTLKQKLEHFLKDTRYDITADDAFVQKKLEKMRELQKQIVSKHMFAELWLNVDKPHSQYGVYDMYYYGVRLYFPLDGVEEQESRLQKAITEEKSRGLFVSNYLYGFMMGVAKGTLEIIREVAKQMNISVEDYLRMRDATDEDIKYLFDLEEQAIKDEAEQEAG